MVHSFLFIGVSVLHVIEFRKEFVPFWVYCGSDNLILHLQSISKRLIWEIYW
jgi:hypothetical protein